MVGKEWEGSSVCWGSLDRGRYEGGDRSFSSQCLFVESGKGGKGSWIV